MLIFDFLTFIAVVALLSAFILLLLAKIGMIDWFIVHGFRLLSDLAQCQFCLSWWTNVAVTVVACLFFVDWYTEILLIPFVATPITRKLLW